MKLLNKIMKFIHKNFFDNYRSMFGRLRQTQVNGISQLLTFTEQDSIWDKLTKDITIKQIAYMFATVKHECADTWHPIVEFGKGKGRSYGELKTVKSKSGKLYRGLFYGRGYVQLTHDFNYKKASEDLDLDDLPGDPDDELLKNPELATVPKIAYQIMSHGMVQGWFTGKKLSQYINAKMCDYYHARRIINALDKAKLIEGYAKKLELCFQNSWSIANA